MSEVESLEGHYFDLKGKLSIGALTPDEFRNQVARLWFEDESGHTWMIGANTGSWYVYKNDLWTLSDPPRDHTLQDTVLCPRCGQQIDARAMFCGHCGYRLQAATPASVPPADEVPIAQTVATATPAAASAAAPRLRVRQPEPTPDRRPPRRLIIAASGALVFGVIFVCLAALGGLLLVRNAIPTSPAVAAAATTPNGRQTATATPSRTTTPIVATLAATAGPIVPTPIIVYISTATPTPPAESTVSTPTEIALAATATVDLSTPTDTPTSTPTAGDTGTPTPAPPTNTPRPPTDTPTPRPPAPTPVPAIVMSGHIAYTVFNPVNKNGAAYDTYLSATDGSGKQMVAPQRRQPQFSPDGSRLVTMGMEPDKQKIWIRSLVNGGETSVENTPPEAMEPSWSPEGNTILYASTEMDDHQSRLYPVDARGASDSRQFLRVGRTDLIGRYPTWLPNGQIVYTGCDKWGGSGQCGVIRVNPDGQSPTLLTANPNDGIDAAPSGRGNTVVFMSHRDATWQIYSVSLNPQAGEQPKNLTNNPSNNGLPTISPDGQFVAFVSDRGGQWAVWAMRLDGSSPRMLFTIDGGYGPGGNVDWTTERISWGP